MPQGGPASTPNEAGPFSSEQEHMTITRHTYRATDPISVQQARDKTAQEIETIITDTLEGVGALEEEGTEAFNQRVYAEMWHNELADVRASVGDQAFADFLADTDWSSTKIGPAGVAAALAELLVPAADIGRVRTPEERLGSRIGTTRNGKSARELAQDDASEVYAKLHQVLGFDQTELARQLEISVATLHNYRKGKTAPRITKTMARTLAAHCDYLAGQLRIAADKAQALSVNPAVKD